MAVAAIAARHYWISNENQFFPSGQHFLLIFRFFVENPPTNCMYTTHPFVSVSFFCSTPIWFSFDVVQFTVNHFLLLPLSISIVLCIWLTKNIKFMGIDDLNANEQPWNCQWIKFWLMICGVQYWELREHTHSVFVNKWQQTATSRRKMRAHNCFGSTA